MTLISMLFMIIECFWCRKSREQEFIKINNSMRAEKKEYVIYFPKFNNNLFEEEIVNIKYTRANDLLDGYRLLYDRSGNLISKSHYNQDKLDGETVHYNVYMNSSDGLKKVKKYVEIYSKGIFISDMQFNK
jgi:hypothetical protein